MTENNELKRIVEAQKPRPTGFFGEGGSMRVTSIKPDPKAIELLMEKLSRNSIKNDLYTERIKKMGGVTQK